MHEDQQVMVIEHRRCVARQADRCWRRSRCQPKSSTCSTRTRWRPSCARWRSAASTACSSSMTNSACGLCACYPSATSCRTFCPLEQRGMHKPKSHSLIQRERRCICGDAKDEGRKRRAYIRHVQDDRLDMEEEEEEEDDEEGRQESLRQIVAHGQRAGEKCEWGRGLTRPIQAATPFCWPGPW